jgi:hypothetical protein
MTWRKAEKVAPPEADFISYQADGRWIVLGRLTDGTIEVSASLNSMGYMIFAAGVSAQKKTLWSYESRMFICGPIELMFRDREAEA